MADNENRASPMESPSPDQLASPSSRDSTRESTGKASLVEENACDAPITPPPGVNEKALVRKIDLRLIPMLFIIYFAAFLDRVNISNALTMGLPQQLGLVSDMENIALTIFFVPYIIFEIPSNILMKKFKPHVWLAGCITAFGIVMLAQGFVTSYSGLLATRFFLGLAEAGIFPGSFYLISIWYKREESQTRMSVYWCSVITAGAFGGLLASAIANMEGIRGLHNWQWIFILEGILTILIGIAAFFFVCDFPEEASWLTEEERSFVVARAGDHKYAKRVTFRDGVNFFKDIKQIVGGIMYLTIVVPIYSFSYFAPTIIKSYGYSTVETQLHTVPPFAAALVLCILIAYLSDRTGYRLPFVLTGVILCIIATAILMTIHSSFSPQYLGICFIAMGAFASGPVVVCWYLMNLHGHSERSIGSAWMIGFGNAGGIIATFTFLSQDAPEYHTGYAIVMGSACICGASSIVYALLVMRDNKKIRAAGGPEKGGRQLYSL